MVKKNEILNLSALKKDLQVFARERDWEQFHTPKNIAMALSVEASEILEIFQWMTSEQSSSLNSEQKEKVADEISDTLVYLVRLADLLDIAIPEALEKKLKKSAEKYPAEIVKGSSRKYTEY